jgi:hypothetical protein
MTRSRFSTPEQAAQGDGELSAGMAGQPLQRSLDVADVTCRPERLARNDIVDRAMPDRLSDGPVTLVGDAAHACVPTLAREAAKCHRGRSRPCLSPRLPDTKQANEPSTEIEPNREFRAASPGRVW